MRRERRGFALIAALWLLVALSAIGLDFSLRARETRRAAANAVEATRARGAANAGVAHARSMLDALLRRAALLRVESKGTSALLAAMDPWRGIGQLLPDSVRLDEARYRVRLSDTGARLNVNLAGETALNRLFVALRIDAGLADRLAQCIIDWRDADDLHHLRGAERDWYLETGARELPSNRSFRDLNELRDVRAVDERVLKVIVPHLTILGSGQINLNAADRPVLLSLPGMTEEAVAVILRLRRSSLGSVSLDALPAQLSSGARGALQDNMIVLRGRTTTETREVDVLSEGWVAGSPVRQRVHTLLVRTGDQGTMVWRREK
ncbi:MAG: type II secretion system protein GspK [Gemmatimonadaceae bacterium]|nr:type II secretion system protein GspK [Gemmatimonadaceae bacterium]